MTDDVITPMMEVSLSASDDSDSSAGSDPLVDKGKNDSAKGDLRRVSEEELVRIDLEKRRTARKIQSTRLPRSAGGNLGEILEDEEDVEKAERSMGSI